MRAYRALRYQTESLFYQLDVKTRWAVLVLTAVLPLLLSWLAIVAFSIEPQRAIEQLRSVQSERLTAETTLNRINAEINSGEYSQLQTRIRALEQQVARSNQAVVALSDSVIRQSDVLPLMTKLLKNYSGITVRTIEKLPAEPILSDQADTQLFKHSVQLVVAGDYLVVLRWLEEVEAFGAKIFWQSLNIQQEGNISVVSLTLHTISLSEEWIDV
ncbi:hypothetical protein [Salinibius halmophilus]|uniref:hypothetical protein n=1 Tax=Salinibius halmophilus TaxID=1853216 RepID=UPI000E66CD33|nr:hypothetical protein [Salinibius halmophilus]